LRLENFDSLTLTNDQLCLSRFTLQIGTQYFLAD
jgi:hypothetical protein